MKSFNTVLFSLLLSLFSINIATAQELIKEVFKTFSDGKPEIVHYYKGDKRALNKIKTETFDQKNNKLEEENFSAGKKHGKHRKWLYYNPKNPILIEDKNYDMDRYEGVQTWRSYDGVISKQLSYSKGKANGKQLEYYEEQRIKYELNYLNGKPEGIQKEWHASGQLKYEMNFKNGVPEGLARIFDYNGKLLELEWKNGQLSTILQKDSQKIKEDYIFNLDSNKLSLDYNYFSYDSYKVLYKTTKYHRNGNPASEQIHGLTKSYTDWYPDGQLKTKGLGSPLDKTGTWTAFHNNGHKASEGTYQKRRKYGEWTTWTDKGWVKTEEKYAWAKIIEKKFYDYYSNGQLKSSGYLLAQSSYRYERKDILWEYWYADGSKKKTETYKPGPYSGNRPFIASFTEWYPDGKVKLEGSDKRATQLFYDTEGKKTAILKIVYQKTRGLHAYVMEGVQRINEYYTKFKGGGTTMNYSYEEGFVEQIEVFYPNGSRKSIFRFCKECLKEQKIKLEGLQEAWYEQEIPHYQINFSKGCKIGEQKEWRRDGSPLYNLIYQNNKHKKPTDGLCSSHCTNGIYYSLKGKEIAYLLKWDKDSYAKATLSGDYTNLKAEEKSKKILEIEAERNLPDIFK